MIDGEVVQFATHVPVDDEGLQANVRHALRLDLPELRDFEYPWKERLAIIASGPSALSADLTGKTLAINGALRLFTERGLAPTYWVACDPQELVAEFLPDAPPRHTTYLVASKCHPKVFEKLRGYNVIIWHVADTATWPLLEDRFPVQAWTSVTLCAFELMARLGWRGFDVWGWDGCFLEGQEYAVPQWENEGLQDVMVGDELFHSTHAWALEAQSATHALAGFPFPVHVHGPGFIAAMCRAFLPKRIVTDPI